MFVSPLLQNRWPLSLLVGSWLVGFLWAGGQSVAPAQTPAAAQSKPAAVAQYGNAVALQNRGLYDLAAAEWEVFLTEFPRDPLAAKARHYRGVCLFQEKDFAGAAAEFTLALDGLGADELAEQAHANLGLAQFNAAQAVASGPAGEAHKWFAQAISTFNEQLTRFGGGELAPQALFYRAESLYSTDQLAGAVESYRLLVEKYRDHPLHREALYGLGVAQEEVGRPDEAARSFARFLADYPDDPTASEIRLRWGESLMAQGRFDDAEEQLSQAAGDSKFAEADYALIRQAACRSETKKWSGAGELYARLVDDFPESQYSPAAVLAAGKCFYLAGDRKQAIEWLQRAVDQGEPAGTRSEAAHWWARALIDGEQPAKALAAVDAALAAQPTDAIRVLLEFDRAEALQELPSRRGEATQAFARFAQTHAEHELGPQAAYLAAYNAFQTGDYQAAAAHAGRFLKTYPESDLTLDVRIVAAEAWLQLGRHEEAEREFRNLIELAPQHAQVPAWRVRQAMSLGLAEDYPGVVASLSPHRGQLTDRELQQQADELLGKAYFRLGKYREAAEALARLDDSRTKPSWYLLRARAHHKIEEYAATLDDIAIYLKSEPTGRSRSQALYLQGLSQAELNKFGQAQESFAAILRDDAEFPHMDRVLYELAWAHQDAGQPAEALVAFSRLAKAHGDSPLAAESWYRLGQSQYTSGAHAAAAESFAEAESRTNDAQLREQALHQLGWSHFQQGDFAAAETAFQKQCEQAPEGRLADDAHVMVGQSLFEQEKYRPALEAFSRADADGLSNRSLQETALLHGGQAAGQLEQWDRSLELLDRCQSTFPDSPAIDEIEYEKGWALYQLGRLEKAQELFDEVAGRNQGVLGARSQFMAGEVRFANKEYDKAVRLFFKVAYGYGDQDAPQPFHHWQSEAMFEAARCLDATERGAAAEKLYRELLERFPDCSKAEHAQNQLRDNRVTVKGE